MDQKIMKKAELRVDGCHNCPFQKCWSNGYMTKTHYYCEKLGEENGKLPDSFYALGNPIHMILENCPLEDV
jgi:hypothetical protein